MSIRGMGIAILAGSAALAAPPAGGPWETTVAADHPLVGVIWDARTGQAISEQALVERLATARFVLLGEKHDNPDHHRLQARVFTMLLAAGRRPALAFEMFDADAAPAVQSFLAEKPADASGLGTAVGWAARSWPPWPLYQQIADPAVKAGLPVLAANLSDALAKAAARRGIEALPEELRGTLRLDEPLSDSVRAAMAQEIADSHCGFAPPGMVEPMILVQRARDAHMAWVAHRGATADGTVLIAGFGHVRTDRAVPAHLARFGATGVQALAFMEVQRDKNVANLYLAGPEGAAPPFDFVWFTPRVDDVDPCEKFRAKLEKLRAAQPTATPAP